MQKDFVRRDYDATVCSQQKKASCLSSGTCDATNRCDIQNTISRATSCHTICHGQWRSNACTLVAVIKPFMIAQTTKICIYAFDFPIGLDVNLASALVILEATYLFIVLILININKRNKFSFVTRTVLVCYTMYLFPPLPKKTHCYPDLLHCQTLHQP